MDQLDKIISHIEAEAKKEAESILADARIKCEELIKDAKAEAKKEKDSALEAQKSRKNGNMRRRFLRLNAKKE